MSIKKEALELSKIIKKFGYWSNEVTKFNHKLPFQRMLKVNDSAKFLVKYS
jgi:hypothetical protein